MAVKFKATIRKDGKIVTEVLDRTQGELCSTIYKVTNAVGKQESDEHIGPECDRVEEVQT
jgi:hypothetical protein